MGNVLKSGSEWLAGQLEQHASEAVRYVRGTTNTEIKATRGQTDFEVDDEYGGIISIRSVDFIVTASNLDFGSGAVDPLVKDKIVVCEGDKEVVYEVAPFGTGQQHFRPQGQHGIMLRIHTQRLTVS